MNKKFLKKISVWIGNFSSYEELSKYKTEIFLEDTSEDGELVEYPNMYYDFKMTLFNDQDIFETYYTKSYNKFWDIIKAQSGDYQFFEQFKEKNNIEKFDEEYNSVILYWSYDYVDEQKKNNEEIIMNVVNENYNVKFVGTFEIDSYDYRLKFPLTGSKYRDEKLKEEFSEEEYQEKLDMMKKRNSKIFKIDYDE